MITRLKIPKPDANIEEGLISAWLRKEGEQVKKGEAVAEIVTDKSTFQLESPKAGILRRILAPAKSTVPVGFIIALIGGEKDPLPDVDKENQSLLAASGRQGNMAAAKPASAGNTVVSSSPGQIRSTPAARRLAKELGLDLAEIAKANAGEVVNEVAVRRHLERGKS